MPFIKTTSFWLLFCVFNAKCNNFSETANGGVLFKKKVSLKISQNSQENTCEEETLAQVFFCEFCDVFKNTFFAELLRCCNNITDEGSKIEFLASQSSLDQLMKNQPT